MAGEIANIPVVMVVLVGSASDHPRSPALNVALSWASPFQVVSGVVTLVLMAGLAYWFFTRKSDKGGPGGGTGDDDLDDPLAEARRIIDKYK